MWLGASPNRLQAGISPVLSVIGTQIMTHLQHHVLAKAADIMSVTKNLHSVKPSLQCYSVLTTVLTVIFLMMGSCQVLKKRTLGSLGKVTHHGCISYFPDD